MLGLKRGAVKLYPHQESWKTAALDTISLIKSSLGNLAVDVQHVGSTSISNISSKPIIDIAIGIKKLDDIKEITPILESKGIVFRGSDHKEQFLFVIGDFEKDTRTHHIHVLIYNSPEWNNYINFRDYLNAFPKEAEQYEKLKKNLEEKYPNDRNSYTNGKMDFIQQTLSKAKIWAEQTSK